MNVSVVGMIKTENDNRDLTILKERTRLEYFNTVFSSNRQKTYESLLAQSLEMERNLMKNSNYGGRLYPLWETPETNMNQGFPPDLMQTNVPSKLEEHIDARHAFSSKGNTHLFPALGTSYTVREDGPIYLDNMDFASSTFSNPPKLSRPSKPQRGLSAFRTGGKDVADRFRNFFQRDSRKRASERLYKERALLHKGRRPRMQLVK